MRSIYGLTLNRADLYKVFDAFKTGVIVIDERGIVTYYNKALEEIDGLEAEFVLGKDLINAYGPEPLPSPMLTCLHTGKPILGFALSYTTVRGRYVSVEQDTYPLEAGGKIIGSIGFIKHFSQLSVSPPVVSSSAELQGGRAAVNFANLSGSCPKFLRAIDTAQKAALTPSPVLLYGETGTGKELFARSIHSASPRQKKPFVGINCSAIPANLLEGVLFGTVKGAFTDAKDRDGLFTEAAGGTIFLDELDSMPLNLQPKLLRVLQEKRIQRIGSVLEEEVDVKIISSLSLPPEELMAKGSLRADLFYRLGVVVIPLPALRERGEDIEELCNYFIIKHNSKLGKRVKGIAPDVLRIFREYTWPGNVRELEHIIEGTMNLMFDEEIIEAQMLPQFFYQSLQFEDMAASVKNSAVDEVWPVEPAWPRKEEKYKFAGLGKWNEAEIDLLKKTLTRTFGSVSGAAELLGLSRQNLYYKMKKYGLNKRDFKRIY